MPKRDVGHMQSQRERILRAAIRCISDLGLERMSVAEIRKEAGLSAGAIYTHFAGKDEIVIEALRFAAMSEMMLPNDWTAFKAEMASEEDQLGFDIQTIARAKLQLLSSAIRSGPLRDMLKPLVDTSIEMLASHLEAMRDAGKIKLRLSPLQAAASIAALTDGLVWIGLARGQSWPAIAETMSAALDCIAELPNSEISSDKATQS